MPSRPWELQTTISTWQLTSCCNTERERETELSERSIGEWGERQCRKESKSREKMLDKINDRIGEKTSRICTNNLKAVTASWSSVGLTRPELSPVAVWLMKKCEAQSERHLRHSFLTVVTVWNRHHCSRPVSETSKSKGIPMKNIQKPNRSQLPHSMS